MLNEKLIGILDMEMGNLRSVSNAVYNMGFDFTMVTTADELKPISHLIVPGVGAYSVAMAHLRKMALIDPIRDFACGAASEFLVSPAI